MPFPSVGAASAFRAQQDSELSTVIPKLLTNPPNPGPGTGAARRWRRFGTPLAYQKDGSARRSTAIDASDREPYPVARPVRAVGRRVLIAD